jgi:hypothetical protein
VDEQGLGVVNAACLAQHEWYASLRRAGFTRLESLYIVTRPSVETARMDWIAAHPDHAQPG